MQEEQDKTMRAGNNIIKSDSDDDKTVRINKTESDSDRTVRIDDSKTIPILDSDATVRLSSNTTSSQSATIPSALRQTPISDDIESFNLNGKEYHLVKTISLKTGEGSIYLIKDDKQNYVLKLYLAGLVPKEELIKKLRSFTHEDIIKVYDYGFFENRFFELMEYAAGGTVEEYMPIKDMKRLKQIIKETTNALRFCHQNGIVHRDLKPGNMFFKNANGTDIILGDFGISSLLDDEMTMQLTGQARTQYYAAPELYLSIDGKTVISKAIDYYALGVTLMFIWSGANPFKGISEFAMMSIKNSGKLPIPDGMPPELNKLVRGLTIVKTENRWGADEIERWLKGEDVELIEQLIESDYQPFLYDTENNLIAHNPKELAELLLKHPAIGVKYLYRGKVSKWLEDSKNQKLAVEIDDIVESVFKDDTDSGLKLAAYTLDPEMPFVAIDDTKCSSLVEFADAFENNFDQYKKLLKNKKDSFYLYLKSKGESKQAQKIQSFYKDNTDEIALLNIIYFMNPDKPFKFVHKKDDKGNTVTYVKSRKELSSALIDHDKEGMDYIFNGSISAWFRFKDDVNMFNWVEYFRKTYEKIDKDSGLMGLCYALDTKLPYYAADKSNCTTKEEIAKALLASFDVYVKRLKYPHSYLHMYFIAKRWDDVLDFTRYCFDSKNHKKKIGFYNDQIALMKVIRTLNKNISFVINGKSYKAPQELLQADDATLKIVQKEIADKNSPVNAWITTFFHEDPFTKEGYEDKLKEYLDFISQLAPKNPFSQKHKEAANTLYKLIDKNKKIDSRFIIGWIIAMIIPTVAAVGLIMYVFEMSSNPLPGAFWNVPFEFYLAVAIIFTVFVFIGMKDEGSIEFSTGCIGGPIAGLIGGVFVYYIIYFIVAIKILFVALIAGGVGFAIYKIINSNFSNKGLKNQIFNTSDKNSMIYEPLKFAFNDEQKFVSSRENLVSQYVKNRRSAKLTILKYSLIATIVALAIWEILLHFDPEYFTITEIITGVFNTIF